MRTFLIHGMGRTAASMALLGRRLRAHGHTVHTFGYLVMNESLPSTAARFVDFIARTADPGEDYAVVGHSLGNIITRMALPELAHLARFVMLAPPNQPPLLARTLTPNPVFRALTRDAGRRLADPAFYAQLPVPTGPALIIAGTKGPRAAWLPFRGAPSDGVVQVEETRLPGVPHVDVPCLHTFIMNDGRVTALCARFIADGTLAHGAVESPGAAQ